MMKFEVYGPDNKRKMYTESAAGIPYDQLNAMHIAKYKFLIDGRVSSVESVMKLRGTPAISVYKIRCVETGELFDKQSLAAKALNIDPAQVSDSIKTGKKRSGYTFIKELVS